MFDSLDAQMKHDLDLESTRTQRIAKNAVIAVLSVILFGGLVFAVRMVS